jgi:DmsE family decaheme c-type cytochrome
MGEAMNQVRRFAVRRKLLFLPILVTSMLATLAAPNLEAQRQGESRWTGERIACGDCHDAIQKQFRITGHGKAMEFSVGTTDVTCGSCHSGDLAKHSETSDPQFVHTPSKERPLEAEANCLSCHSNDKTHMFWLGSAHETAGVSCLNCHSIHSMTEGRNDHLMAKRTESETCLSCHGEVRKAMFQRSRHLFRDERATLQMECSSCHNAHGTQTEKLISANSINDKCYSCHQEKRGPFLWEHSPVRESCITCHSPHGSNNPRLLTLRVPQLCQSCHDQQRHQVILGRPNAMWNINRACINCHPQIHGSNHPSGTTLNN